MSMMDIVWSLGLGAGTIFLFLETEIQSFSSWAALGLMLLWSARMGSHLFFNRILSDKEDSRYQRLKDHSGASWKWVFLLCFLLQVVFIFIFLFPIKAAIQASESGIGILQVFGLIIGCLALVGETLSDIQLDRFCTNPENKKRCARKVSGDIHVILIISSNGYFGLVLLDWLVAVNSFIFLLSDLWLCTSF